MEHMLKRALHALYAVLRDVAYGINAGNAIRHGRTPSPRRR